MKIRKNTGFTLVELMIVVVIIGILTAIAIPIYASSRKKTANNACLYNQRVIHSASEEYKTNNGVYPENVVMLVDEGYLKAIPNCSGLNYETINADGFVECPKTNNKHSN